MFEPERLNRPTKLENEANCAAKASIWPCQICRRSRFNGYELARILLPAEPHACPDCGDGSFR